jgi:hypothetical protein
VNRLKRQHAVVFIMILQGCRHGVLILTAQAYTDVHALVTFDSGVALQGLFGYWSNLVYNSSTINYQMYYRESKAVVVLK